MLACRCLLSVVFLIITILTGLGCNLNRFNLHFSDCYGVWCFFKVDCLSDNFTPVSYYNLLSSFFSDTWAFKLLPFLLLEKLRKTTKSFKATPKNMYWVSLFSWVILVFFFLYAFSLAKHSVRFLFAKIRNEKCTPCESMLSKCIRENSSS